MPMPGRNPWHANVYGLALAPQSITAAAANGASIVEPWKDGRWLNFILNGGVFVAASVGEAKIQGLLRSDGTTWEDVLNKDGTVLKFPDAVTSKGGALEGGTILGSIDLTAIDGDTYKALRVVFTVTGAPAIIVGGSYEIYMRYRGPSGQTEYLYQQMRYES